MSVTWRPRLKMPMDSAFTGSCVTRTSVLCLHSCRPTLGSMGLGCHLGLRAKIRDDESTT
eukprot:7245839-Pyramimonas_sp.AAC.1